MGMHLDDSFQFLVDQDEVNFKVVQQLNSVFGNDLKCLEKASGLVKELTRTKEELEKRVSLSKSLSVLWNWICSLKKEEIDNYFLMYAQNLMQTWFSVALCNNWSTRQDHKGCESCWWSTEEEGEDGKGMWSTEIKGIKDATLRIVKWLLYFDIFIIIINVNMNMNFNICINTIYRVIVVIHTNVIIIIVGIVDLLLLLLVLVL